MSFTDKFTVIGLSEWQKPEGNKTKVKTRLFKNLTDNPNVALLAEDNYNAIKQGWKAPSSITFLPKSKPRDNEHGGKIFDKTEILDYSLVIHPAQTEAFMNAIKNIEVKSEEFKEIKKNFELEIRVKNLEDMIINKSVITFHAYPLSPIDEVWDAGQVEANASVDDLKKICAWYDSSKSEDKGSYKLPHHKLHDFSTVWDGVKAAMGALLGARGGVNIPESDRRGVYNHLARHYKEFEKEVPEFKTIIDNEVICGHCNYKFDYLKEPEICMGAVKCPNCSWAVDQEGNAYKPEEKQMSQSDMETMLKDHEDRIAALEKEEATDTEDTTGDTTSGKAIVELAKKILLEK